MSPKIAFALLLLGCALLGLANADRWNNQESRWNPYGTRRIPVAPGSQGNECNCPCGETGQGQRSIDGGNQGIEIGGSAIGDGGWMDAGGQETHGLNGVKAHDYDPYHG